MEERILAILEEANDEIIDYDGDNMIEDGIIDSFGLIDIVYSLEEEFGIEIDASLVLAENFGNKDKIIALIESLIEE